MLWDARHKRGFGVIAHEKVEFSDNFHHFICRGGSYTDYKSRFSEENRPVLYVVITRAEVAALKAIVHEIDPLAFMVIGVAHEAFGEGFKPLKSK